LSSPTPSRVSDKRKQFIANVIQLQEQEQPKQEQLAQPADKVQDDGMQKYHKQLQALYDDAEDNDKEYAAVFIAHYQSTPFPQELKQDTRFYEYFYTVDEYLGSHDE